MISIMGLDSSHMRHNIYLWSSEINPGWDIIIGFSLTVVFALAVGISAIIQAVLCIQTSTERNTCCKRCCCMLTDSDRHYAVIDGKDTYTATNPASSRVSQPSYTNFAIPYTGGFTQMTASINRIYRQSEQSQRQLIECTMSCAD